MRLLQKAKDGGPDSPVDAYFLCEFKGLFSIALLKFNKGTRENYHTHAFNAWTWFLKGSMVEHSQPVGMIEYTKSILPKYTPRTKNHRVVALRDSWAITLRGPWSKTWTETTPEGETITWENKMLITLSFVPREYLMRWGFVADTVIRERQ